MSEFGNISISASISFSYLDLISSMLLRDTKELEADYQTKLQYVIEKEQNLMLTKQNLEKIHKSINMIKNCVMKLELELQQNDCIMVKAERALTDIEELLQRFDGKDCNFNERSDYMEFMELLLSAQSFTAKRKLLKKRLERYRKYLTAHAKPKNISIFKKKTCIIGIADCHCKALMQIEGLITDLKMQSNEISQMFDDEKK
ncbi:uncharacterized protein LOC115621622 [Scaptodrosophila lebanonensis]|uniref:Uncharacterized protein LOC115621622 n=1 Tax=Drosophila lebanonensis TaxID=7225 RepID=A0A6J2T8A9_DROLE|nr:uncharacterized protein LOC115621622 [Scaptodrosophila lebanonensis]